MFTFENFNIDGGIIKGLAEMDITEPTPIQKSVIPIMLDGKDVLAKAPTGTGKTCAFIIPIIDKIAREESSVQALIICPTRELVLQITEEIRKVSKGLEGIRTLAIYGGQNIERQLYGLRKRPQIIVGTPGRILDHLRRRTLKLNSLNTLVLDEADEMLNMGFREDIDDILKSVDKKVQTVMFSATVPKEIEQISKNYQTNPEKIVVKGERGELPEINEYSVIVKEKNRVEALISIIKKKGYKLCLAFCNTKKRVDELSGLLRKAGINAEGLHGDMRQKARDAVMNDFRKGGVNLLVATDVAARGIDVSDIDAVFNFDAPSSEEFYVHRIGRTARAKKKGDAFTFVSAKQKYLLNMYEKYTKKKILPYEYNLNEEIEIMEERKLQNALNIIAKNNNKEKEKINLTLKEYNETNGTEYTPLDLFAAYVRANTIIFEMKEDDSVFLPKSKKNDMVEGAKRFFINIGTRDKVDEEKLKDYVMGSTEISEVYEVKLLDNFGFLEIPADEERFLMSLNGNKFQGRVISVEAAESADKNSGRKSGGKGRGRSSSVSSKGKASYGKSSTGGGKAYLSRNSRSGKSAAKGKDEFSFNRAGDRKSARKKSDVHSGGARKNSENKRPSRVKDISAFSYYKEDKKRK